MASFTLDQLQAINEWQRWDDTFTKAQHGQQLKAALSDLDPKYRVVDLPCYRRIELDKKYLWKLGDELHIAETISSWSTDLSFAERFKGGVPPKGYNGLLFRMIPSPSQVVVNLNIVYNDSEFKLACSQYEQFISNYDEGIGLYGNRESEIVLDVSALKVASIHSFGGYSADEEGLLKMYSLERHGCLPNRSIRREFARGMKRTKQVPGPAWVSGLGRDRAIAVLLDAVKVLKPYKQ